MSFGYIYGKTISGERVATRHGELNGLNRRHHHLAKPCRAGERIQDLSNICPGRQYPEWRQQGRLMAFLAVVREKGGFPGEKW